MAIGCCLESWPMLIWGLLVCGNRQLGCSTYAAVTNPFFKIVGFWLVHLYCPRTDEVAQRFPVPILISDTAVNFYDSGSSVFFVRLILLVKVLLASEEACSLEVTLWLRKESSFGSKLTLRE